MNTQTSPDSLASPTPASVVSKTTPIAGGTSTPPMSARKVSAREVKRRDEEDDAMSSEGGAEEGSGNSAQADVAQGPAANTAAPTGQDATTGGSEASASVAENPAPASAAKPSAFGGNLTRIALGGLGLAAAAAGAGGGSGNGGSGGTGGTSTGSGTDAGVDAGTGTGTGTAGADSGESIDSGSGVHTPGEATGEHPEVPSTRPPVQPPGVSTGNGTGPIGQGGAVHVDVPAGTDWEFSTDGGQTWQPGQGSTIPAGDLGEGVHDIIVVVIDEDGNRGEPAEISVEVDLTPPSQPPSVDVVDGAGVRPDGTHVINGNGTINIGGLDPDADWEFSTDGGQTWQPGTGSGITADQLDEGHNTIQVVQVDEAGNHSDPITIEVIKDTVAEVPQLGVTGGAGGEGGGAQSNGKPPVIGSGGSVSIGGLEPNADWEFSTDGGQTWQPGTGASISADQLTEGSNIIQVVQIDEAGNQSQPAQIEVIKDTVAPQAPQIDAVGTGIQGGSGQGSGKPPVINGAGIVSIGGLEPDADWQFSTDGGHTWQPGTGSSIPADQLAEGSNIIQVVQTDAAGNQSQPAQIEVIKDTVAPQAPQVDVTGNGQGGATSIINGAGSVSIGGLEPDADWQFSTDGGVTWQPGNGSSIPADQLAEGSNIIQVVQIDAAGNQSQPAQIEVIKDTTTPQAPVDLPVLTVNGGVDVASVTVINGSGSIGVSGIGAGGSWSFSLDGGKTWVAGQGDSIGAGLLAEGVNSVRVVQIDATGSTSAVSEVILSKDTIVDVPQVTVTGGKPFGGNISISGSAVITVSGLEVGAAWKFSTDGGQTWIQGQGTSFDVGQLPEGLSSIDFVQIDAVGNISKPTAIFLIKDSMADAPHLSVVGGTSVGQHVAINGSGSVAVSDLERDATWSFSLDGGVTWQAGHGNSLSAGQLNEGTNSIKVIQTDGMGNISAASTLEVIRDTQADALTLGVPLGTHVAGKTYVRDGGGIDVAGVETDATWSFSTDGGRSWITGTGSSIASADLREGLNVVQVVQVDAVGNTSPVVTLEVIKDTAVDPIQVSVTGNGGATLNGLPLAELGSQIEIQGLEEGASWSYMDANQEWVTGVGNSLDPALFVAGEADLHIFIHDLAGNSSLTTVRVYIGFDVGISPFSPAAPTSTSFQAHIDGLDESSEQQDAPAPEVAVSGPVDALANGSQLADAHSMTIDLTRVHPVL